MNKIILDVGEQTFEQKTVAATFIASFGAANTGIRTKAQLMHPLRKFSDDDAQREAGRFLGNALVALLQEQPRQVTDKLLKDQAESVLFAE
tara:strand:- start:206 stop:478 length:273 start_codon:yes stop_codon:yes gene_type:complete